MNTVEILRSEIETALDRKLTIPKDFEFLRERIYARQHVLLSRTTLMRLWGYIEEDVKPRKSTLDILSRFLGYQGWDEYSANCLLPKEHQSSPVLTRSLSVEKELVRGDRLRLTWLPDRICEVKYLDNRQFVVTAAENTRLRIGDTFECSLIIEGEPLYLDHLVRDDESPIVYVCGKKSGIRYEYL